MCWEGIDMTVKELITALQALPENEKDFEVRCWMPGQHIELSPYLIKYQSNAILIEGNTKDFAS